MKPSTVQALNAVNQRFYAAVADDFDATRQRPWEGWQRLLDFLPAELAPLRVLDVACGNGRLGAFLGEQRTIVYRGLDSSPALLAHARASAEAWPFPADFDECDLVRDGLVPERGLVQSQPPDLIACFGFLHHVPSLTARLAFVGQMAALRPRLLAFSTWRFAEFDKFRQRFVPFPPEVADDVEAGDYLLDWRRGALALRYCHCADDAEQVLLEQASGLTLLARYRADTYNVYSLLG
ncbi:MAG: class I SAM-dependent methyltransferase [Anaerolineae bacterium]|nr:class I SAM-dependent methyltransferase [Anaerolineae bacterium]MDW8173503.1 class I SAM-dependent methyltransferase [Anaerolineae bacterium]